MAHKVENARYKRNLAIVRQLLNEEWDPIGGCPEDEYDTYSIKLYGMLMSEGVSAEVMAEYLYDIESERMGLGRSLQRKKVCVDVVAKLIAMKSKLDAANDA